MSDLKMVSTRLDKNTIERLKQHSLDSGVKIKVIIQVAINEYLAKVEKKD